MSGPKVTAYCGTAMLAWLDPDGSLQRAGLLKDSREAPPDPLEAPLDPPGYAARVAELEAEGLTTSDAQGVADVELDARGHAVLVMSARLAPVRRLECCCCGGDAGRFHQHWNRDTGYGICARCVAAARARGESADEILDLYGVEGVNFEAPAVGVLP